MSVVDRNFSSWECFDVSTASTLFWKQVPFIYKTAEREDVREKFTVRILTGLTKTNHNLKVEDSGFAAKCKVQGSRF